MMDQEIKFKTYRKHHVWSSDPKFNKADLLVRYMKAKGSVTLLFRSEIIPESVHYLKVELSDNGPRIRITLVSALRGSVEHLKVSRRSKWYKGRYSVRLISSKRGDRWTADELRSFVGNYSIEYEAKNSKDEVVITFLRVDEGYEHGNQESHN